eukprot:scaffold57092_cov18-Tisochrysis_lutea.AAC.1
MLGTAPQWPGSEGLSTHLACLLAQGGGGYGGGGYGGGGGGYGGGMGGGGYGGMGMRGEAGLHECKRLSCLDMAAWA